MDTYCVLISSKVVYFLKPGEFVDREAIFLEVKYDDLYHCLVSRDHGKVYVQLTKKADSSGSGVAIPGPSQQRPMVGCVLVAGCWLLVGPIRGPAAWGPPLELPTLEPSGVSLPPAHCILGRGNIC